MRPPLLLEVLRGEREAHALSPQEWSSLIQQARRGALLAELGRRLDPEDARIPAGARHALRWAQAACAQQQRILRWELRCILEALAPLGIPVGLLKGMAYLIEGHDFAQARLFADIDLLVPRRVLGEVEKRLFLAGYVKTHSDPYDERYYREWMHEIPPLQHVQRGTSLDVHHTIAPPTSRYAVEAERLFERMVPVAFPDAPMTPMRLGDEDLVLHCALHLYTESEFFHGLRDLCDLVGLLEVMEARRPDFGERLIARARELGMARLLYLAMRHAAALLGDTHARAIAEGLEDEAPRGRVLYDACFERALMPLHPDCADAFTGVARSLLYVRGHALRMPLRLLVPHLARKAWKGIRSERTP